MKYSVALVSAFAAASVAGPIEARENKKPFVKATIDASLVKECRDGSHSPTSEFCSGTRAYCNEKFYKSEGEPFNSVQDCFRSRETPAFQEPPSGKQRYLACGADSLFWGDRWMPTSEACLGTIEWCNQKIYVKDGELFDSPKACINSRKTAQSGANTQVNKGDDVRQKQDEYCANNELGLGEAACKILFAQCAFDNQDATSFDAIAECVESRA